MIIAGRNYGREFRQFSDSCLLFLVLEAGREWSQSYWLYLLMFFVLQVDLSLRAKEQ